jgi:crotonobetainyl-CoA:carnitine CoA-transferase CaiB-like acyl-CoA transferase
VLAALLHRERTGEGQLVQVNMLDALIALQMQELTVRTVGGVPQSRGREIHAHCYIRAPYGIFPTADGYLSLAFADLSVLAEVLQAPALARWDTDKDGFTHRDEISALITERVRTQPTGHWLAALGERGIWAGPVYSYDDLLAGGSDRRARGHGGLGRSGLLPAGLRVRQLRAARSRRARAALGR